MQSISKFVLWSALIIALSEACKCRQEAFCKKTQRADYLLRGIVKEVNSTAQDVSYRLEIKTAFKPFQQPSVIVRSAASSASCGLKLAVGDDYLFAIDSQLWITSCSATTPWSSIGGDELRVLKAGGLCDNCAALSCRKDQICAIENDKAYCTDSCAGRCSKSESCSLVSASNCDNAGPCPNVAVCNPNPLRTSCMTNCSTEFIPVCGSNGITYRNECFLKNFACKHPDVVMAKAGECCTRSCCKFRQCRPFSKGEYCTDTCHADRCPKGQRCRLQKAKSCTVDLCPDVAVCESVCKANCDGDYLPLCGSNGVTFANPCELQRAQCTDSSLVRLHLGVCSSLDSMCGRLNQCPELYEPICGSDGVTYPNICYLERSRCHNLSLQVSHEGKCGKSCDLGCPTTGSPVCSNQGITYANECLLKQAACKQGNIWLRKQGACDKC